MTGQTGYNRETKPIHRQIKGWLILIGLSLAFIPFHFCHSQIVLSNVPDDNESKQYETSIDIERRTDQLLAEAIQKAATDEAIPIINQTQQYLNENKSRLSKLTTAFIQTNINQTHGRVLMTQWRNASSDEALRIKAQKFLTASLNNYSEIKKMAEQQAESIRSRLIADYRKNKQWQLYTGYVTRIKYANAWTTYSLAITQEDKIQHDNTLQQAIKIFNEFTKNGYQNHPVIIDCFLGQSLCLYEMEKFYDVTALLNLNTVTLENTPISSYKRLLFLRINAAKKVPSDLYVVWTAQHYFLSLQKDHQFDFIELQMLLSWAESLKHMAVNPLYKSYQDEIFGQMELIAEMIFPYNQPWCDRFGEILGDVTTSRPFGSLVRSKKLFAEKKFKEVTEETKIGLKSATDTTSEKIVAELRYLRAAAFWNDNDWYKAFYAVDEYLMYHPDGDHAMDLANYAVLAGFKSLTSDNPVSPAVVLQSLDSIEKHWPDSDIAKKIPWYRGSILLENRQYKEAEKAFINVPSTSAYYNQAQYGIALSIYQQTTSQLKDKTAENQEERTEEASKRLHQGIVTLANAIDHMESTPPDSDIIPPDDFSLNITKLTLAVIQIQLDIAPDDVVSCQALLSKLKPVVPNDKRWEKRLSAVQIETYAAATNIEKLIETVVPLVNEPLDDSFTIRASLKAANTLDVEYKTLDSSSTLRSRLDKILTNIYYALYQYSQEDENNTLEETTIRFKLADILFRSEQYSNALTHYAWLLENLPAETTGSILRNAAIASEKTDDYTQSAIYWQRLAQGLPRYTEPWFEANYHHFVSLDRSDQSQRAQKQLNYFILRYPMDPGKWKDQFDQLSSQLAQPGEPLSSEGGTR